MLKDELTKKIIGALLNLFKGELLSVILYGSYAEGRETQYSDIDLLVVLNRDFPGWREKRQTEVSLRKETSAIGPVSPRVMTEREFSSAFENYDPLVLNVLSSGKALYDAGTFGRVKDLFEKAENRKITRTTEGYWEVSL